MSEQEIIWVVVSTNSFKEAEKIGQAALKARLCVCYSIWPRLKTAYFWPPKSGKIQSGRGPILSLESLEKNYKKITSLINKLHSDKVPMYGILEIEKVSREFYRWVKSEM